MVGLSRLERLTSPLSAECSNRLSYRPISRIYQFSDKTLDFNNTYIEQHKMLFVNLPRKEVIQPQVLLRLPCYDFTPITIHTLGIRLLFRLAKMTLGTNSSHGVTGGVYKVRERIHRAVMMRDY